MSTTRSTPTLPPSARDFLVYELVKVGQASTRQAAAEAQISQTRIRQVVGKVLDWLAEALPAKTTLQAESQLVVARHIAADRLEAFYRDAKRKFDATDQCKYANFALRVIAAQSKLPAVAGHYEALMADILENSQTAPGSGVVCEDSATSGESSPQSTEGPLRVTEPSDPPQPSSPPPPRDCSPASAITSPPPTSTTPESNSTPSSPEPSATLSPRTKSTRRAFLSTAHSPLNDADESLTAPITELKISPQTAGISMQPPLSRQQRRRLRRAQLANK